MTPDERLRRRLEALNRGPLPAAAVSADQPMRPRVARPPAATSSCSAATPSPLAGAVKPIPGLIRRGEVVTNVEGEHLRVTLAVDDLWPHGERLAMRRHETLAARRQADEGEAAPVDAEVQAFLDAFPHDALLLDLETCGLAGSALFLIGLLRTIDDRLTVELLLARDYSEERAVLSSLWRCVDRSSVVVTYNGKSFDWPMVLDRTARHLLFRSSRPPTPKHVDLLHAARRRWKKQLPDCKLQTVEQRICGRRREGDISGARIPAAYQEFVRTGFTRDLDAILLHNAIDLVTLLDVGMRLADG